MTKLTDHERLLLTMVAEEFNVTFDDLFTRTRKREICEPRQVAMYFLVQRNLKKYKHALYQQVGQKFFKKGVNEGYDHCSVMHTCNKVRDIAQTDKHFRIKLLELEARLTPEMKIKTPEEYYADFIGRKKLAKQLVIEFAINYKNHCYYEQI